MGTVKQGTLHFATNDHVKKLGIFHVPFSRLEVLPDFNDREDYGTAEEMNELAESIYHTGPRVPLKGYKDGENYVVIVGHRRFRAGEMIKKKYGKNIVFPIQVYPPGASKKDMLIDTLLTNSGKDLTPLEKASTVSKLFVEKVPVEEIASSLGGVSQVYIKNLQRLWSIPEEAKKLIRDGVVSATLIMGYLKNKGANLEEFIEEIKKQASLDDQKGGGKKGRRGKQAKVTAKKTRKGKNSLQEFKRFMKEQVDVFASKERKNAFEFFSSVVKNEKSYLDIVEFFTGK